METRVCKVCNQEKRLSAFPTRKAPNGVPYRRHKCSACRSSEYRKTPTGHLNCSLIAKKAKTKYVSLKHEMREQLFLHIGQTVCKFCKFSDHRALCFHHRSPDNKKFTIKFGLTHSYCLETLKVEAEKCDVLCANCHTLYHYKGQSDKAIHASRLKIKLFAHLGQFDCQACGYTNPVSLCFHHLRDKLFKISQAINRVESYSIDDIYKEVEKCKVLCNNCHLIHHLSCKTTS